MKSQIQIDKHFLEFFQSHPFAGWLCDEEWNIYAANKQAVKEFGFSAKHWLNVNFRSLTIEWTGKKKFFIRVSAKDGQNFSIECRFVNIIARGKKIRYVSGVSVQAIPQQLPTNEIQDAITKASIVSVADKKGIITYVNDNFVDISGYNASELIGKNHRIINSGHHPKSFWKEMWACVMSGKTWRAEVKNRTKKGTYYWVDTFIIPFLDANGGVKEILSIRNDITARKNSEVQLAEWNLRLSETLIFGKMGSAQFDLHTQEVIVSVEALRLLDVNASVPQKLSLEEFLSRYVQQEFFAVIKQAIKQGFSGADVMRKLINSEFAMVTATGRRIWIEALGIFQDDKAVGILHDVTDKRLADEAVREKNVVINNLLNGITDGFFGTDRDLRYTVVSPLAAALANMKPQDMAGKHVLEVFPHLTDSLIYKRYQEAIRTGLTDVFDYENESQTGQFFEVSLYPNPEGLFVFYRDITARKQTEQEISKLALIARHTSNAVVFTDREGRITWTNEGFQRISGYSLHEVMGRKPGDFLQGSETNEGTRKYMREALSKGEGFKVEILNYAKNGRQYWLDLEVMPIHLNETVTGFMAIQSDITSLKVAMNEMSRSNQMMRSIANNLSASLIFQCITKGTRITTFQYVSEGVNELLGISADNVMAKPSLVYDQIFHDDAEQLVNRARQASDNNEVFDFEYRIKCRGKTKWIRTRATPFRLDEQQTMWDGLSTDISRQKELEEKILESEERFRTLVQDIDVGIMLQGPQTEIFLCNRAALELTGLTEDQLLGKTVYSPIWNFIREDGSEFLSRDFPVLAAIKTKRPVRGVVMGYTRPTLQDTLWLLADAIPTFNSDGSIKYVVCTFSDITEMRNAQLLLRKSEERYRQLFELNPIPTWIFDRESLRFLHVNQAASSHYGFSRDEFLQMKMSDITPLEEQDKLMIAAQQGLHTKHVMRGQIMLSKHIKKDQSLMDVEILSTPFPVASRQAILMTVNDVTEKIITETTLRSAVEEKELLIKEIHHRIKNNLQLISSILYIRMSRMHKNEFYNFLDETRQRIRSIALIHERLLQTGTVNEVNIADYLNKLLLDLKMSYSNLDFHLSIESQFESLNMNLDQAINCGLILNELFTNTIKHAFQGRQQGKVSIIFKRNDNQYILLFMDDGIGLPEHIQPGMVPSFGMQLLDVFIKQLKAQLTVERNAGTSFKMVF